MGAKVFCRMLLITVIGVSLTHGAETNSMPQLAQLFILLEPHLRTEPAVPLKSPSFPIISTPRKIKFISSPTDAKTTVQESLRVDHTFLNPDRDDPDSPYHHYPSDFGLILPIHRSDDPLTRCLDSVFRPEEFHVGKTTVSCSILTAIKRKNPLCLINPIFLNVSW